MSSHSHFNVHVHDPVLHVTGILLFPIYVGVGMFRRRSTMLHVEHLRELRDDHLADIPSVESVLQDDQLVPTTFPPLVWISQNGKKYHTLTACPSLKYSQPTSRGLCMYCSKLPVPGTSSD